MTHAIEMKSEGAAGAPSRVRVECACGWWCGDCPTWLDAQRLGEAHIGQLRPMVNEFLRQRVENALETHGVHWNGPVEPTGPLVDAIVAAFGPPSDAWHEQDAQGFIGALDNLLIDALGLSTGKHTQIFERRDELRARLRELLRDASWKASEAERKRVLAAITKELR